MYAGRIVEDGPASELIRSPKHPYTHGLVSAIPDPLIPRRLRGIPGVSVGVEERDRGCAFAPRCQFQIPTCLEAMPALAEVTPQHRSRCIRWAETPAPTIEPPFDPPADGDRGPLLEVRSLNASHKSRFGQVVAAQDVSFSVALGECVALVGESGSGKTTIARCIVGLHAPDAGEIQLDGEQLSKSARSRPVEARRRVQIVFQNPYDSLNPRHTTGQIIERPARQLRRLSQSDARLEMRSLLGLVRLPARTADRYPSELSGGERQRVAIARALAAKPSLLVCDEITSALDVSVQAAVLELIAELRQELGLSLLFISHDLGVVGSISDRILVLRTGRVREEGRAASVLEHPADEYTKQLIAAAPRLDGLDPASSRSPDTEESR
jgi:peptide/nickel transport system ATP-binding protein